MSTFESDPVARRYPGETPFSPRNLTGLLAPLRARIDARPWGHELSIDPMTARDGARAWDRLGPSGAAVLIFERHLDDRAATTRCGLDRALDEMSITPIESFGFARHLVAGDGFTRLVSSPRVLGLVAARVDGPVETGDVRAMARAMAMRRSPLEAELRVSSTIEIQGGRLRTASARNRNDLLPFVAESFRNFLGAMRSEWTAPVALPDLGLVERLFEASGQILVRPIEAEIYSTAIDIGVVTAPAGEMRPADCSLIYDLFGNTWHGD